MTSMPYSRSSKSNGLFKLAIFVWIGIIFLSGTYIRNRAGNEEPEVDWLVMAQIAACAIGAVLGIALMYRTPHLGKGAKVILIYIGTTGISAVFSPYPTTVSGYWVLLVGAALMTIGIVQRVQTAKELRQIENAWLVTVTVVLFKDMVISLLSPEVQANGEVVRLGMGVTHANAMSLLAGLAFWVSLRKETKSEILLWLCRLLFLFIMFASRARMTIIGFIIAGAAWLGFRYRIYAFRWLLISCFFAAVIILGCLGLSFDSSWAVTTFEFVNRGQDLGTIMSLTGRTEIWPYVIQKVFNGPLINTLWGYGYGVSRLVLNGEGGDALPFYAYHCHNAFLEHLLGMGIIGLIPFLVLVGYSTKWITRFKQLHLRFPPEFSIRAAIIVLMFITVSLLEIRIGGKINPSMILYLFYIVTLDKRLNSVENKVHPYRERNIGEEETGCVRRPMCF